MTDAPVLAVRGLAKAYAGRPAVDGVSFHVARDEIVGLLGPNGAGKTTIINMVLGLLEPDAGDIAIDGIDLARRRAAALSQANFSAVYAALPGNLTVRRNLRLFAGLYGVRRAAERVDAVLSEFGLGALADRRYGLLSSGEQARVGLAKAMLNAPALLLLDFRRYEDRGAFLVFFLVVVASVAQGRHRQRERRLHRAT